MISCADFFILPRLVGPRSLKCLFSVPSINSLPTLAVGDCAKRVMRYEHFHHHLIYEINRTSCGSSCISLSPVKCHAAVNLFSFGFKEPRIRECARRVCVGRVDWWVWFWWVRNHARGCHVITHTLSLVCITLHLPPSGLTCSAELLL